MKFNEALNMWLMGWLAMDGDMPVDEKLKAAAEALEAQAGQLKAAAERVPAEMKVADQFSYPIATKWLQENIQVVASESAEDNLEDAE